MLKSLLESKLSTKFMVIADAEDASGQGLFITALRNHIAADSVAEINLICYENPVTSYLPNSVNRKVIVHDYFIDPCGWTNLSAPKSDLASFITQPLNLSQTTFFIDSLTHFTNYHGFCIMYKVLSALKEVTHKLVCLAHCDLFSPEQVEELQFLATAFLTLNKSSNKRALQERTAEVIYKKSGGKLIKQSEIFSILDELKVISRVSGTKTPVSLNGKKVFQELTTFKLGLQMNEKERKAKDELILPYVKSKVGGIIYEPEADELEEDPDDDLDI